MVNYSLLVMDSVRMMKMATGDGSPSGRVPERGSDWFFVVLEACSGGTPDLSSVLEVLGYKSIYGCKGYIGGPPGCSRGRGALKEICPRGNNKVIIYFLISR